MTDYNAKAAGALAEITEIDVEIAELDSRPRMMTPDGYRREPHVHARINSLISRRRDLLRLADTYGNLAIHQELERLVGILDRPWRGVEL